MFKQEDNFEGILGGTEKLSWSRVWKDEQTRTDAPDEWGNHIQAGDAWVGPRGLAAQIGSTRDR